MIGPAMIGGHETSHAEGERRLRRRVGCLQLFAVDLVMLHTTRAFWCGGWGSRILV